MTAESARKSPKKNSSELGATGMKKTSAHSSFIKLPALGTFNGVSRGTTACNGMSEVGWIVGGENANSQRMGACYNSGNVGKHW